MQQIIFLKYLKSGELKQLSLMLYLPGNPALRG